MDTEKQETTATVTHDVPDGAKNLAANMNQTELDNAALENLVRDKTEVIQRLEKIIDRITMPVSYSF